MNSPPDIDVILDTICTLAMDVARQCPDCAEPATRIASLAGQVRVASVDRGAIQDALESEMGDSGISDLRVRSATEAVIKATESKI